MHPEYRPPSILRVPYRLRRPRQAADAGEGTLLGLQVAVVGPRNGRRSDDVSVQIAELVDADVLDHDEAIDLGERTSVEEHLLQHTGDGQRCADAQSDDEGQ